MDLNAPVIAVDGPTASGKGTISQIVAQQLGWHLLDSGALYRLLALAAQNHALGLDDEPSLVTLARHLDVQFLADRLGTPPRILLEGEDVTHVIRSEECGHGASVVAGLPAVREALLARQRAFRDRPGLVADGRDMGTVVFPDAVLKVFLTASAEERANRRYNQLKQKGMNVNLRNLVREIAARDARDTERSAAPLKPAADAVVLDSTGLSIAQVAERVLRLFRERVNVSH